MDTTAYFDKKMPEHILHVLQQRDFVVRECSYETGLLSVQTCLLFEKNMWFIA